jgi:hypothetical protein
MNNPLSVIDVGFVIANEREEFLSRYAVTRHGSPVLVWSSSILRAQLFKRRNDARRVLKNLKIGRRLWLFTLLNTPGHLVLTSDELDLPPWFSN